MYPNPVQDKLLIESELEVCNVKVFDLLGRLVLEYFDKLNAQDDFYQMDLSTIANGVFLVKVETEEGLLSEKLVKE